MRPPSGPTDRGRLLAAGLSAVLPGLGQLANHRKPLARRFLLPSLAVLGIAWLLVQLFSLPRLAATFVAPSMLSLLLVLNLVVLGWRLAAVGQAFFDRRFTIAPGRLGGGGLVALLLFVALPHLVGMQMGLAARDAFGRIFQPEGGLVAGASATPRASFDGERVNVLLIGIDKTPNRTATLTDTLMVVSLDTVGETVSIVSIPRDTVNVPLGNGDDFGPKLNSLMSYADRHPEDFPEGGRATLQKAVGTLLGIDIHYYALMDFEGFVRMIDAVGGVDIDVAEGFDDPTYDGYGFGQMGYSITAGPHHFSGLEALAYARARKATGESDFTRANRQQEILLALRSKVTSGGSLVFNLPALLTAVGDTVRTDFPVEDLPAVAAIVDGITAEDIVRVVIRHPLVGGTMSRYGSVQVPDVPAIREMAERLFSEPGRKPKPWPTPVPTPIPPQQAPGAPVGAGRTP